MRVLVIGDLLHTPAIERAGEAVDAEFHFVRSKQILLPNPNSYYDILLAGSDHGDTNSLSGNPWLRQCKLIIPLSGTNIAAGIGNIPAKDISDLNAYFAYGGPANLQNGFLRIKQLLEKTDHAPLPPPSPVLLDGIYTLSGQLYDSLAQYTANEMGGFSQYVGMLSYRSRWIDGNIAVESAIIESLERRGIGVISAFTDGSPNEELGTLSFQKAIDRFFCKDGRPVIDLLINFQFFGAKAADGEDMFTQAAACYEKLDIPVVRPVGLANKTEATWRASQQPYSSDLATNFIAPELQGMIEPIHISCTDEQHRRTPINDRVERFAGRLEKWISMRHKKESEKKIALILHNAPCAGVEATVGHATNLDAFQSTVDILHRLNKEGYKVSNIPKDGHALKDLIFSKKAFSDFRWTAAEDIEACGGALYQMDLNEYSRYYNTLSIAARETMEANWGKAPGEAMVLNHRLLITGISFGNVLVMVQPKRGCFGAKCTGEVCKILQDPSCPPTHQYLATYWYLQHTWKADAVIHLGTHGSLEYLPGKANGLSRDCFTDIAIGDLINLYPYCSSVISQALIARRRSYAVTISYLPSPGKGLDPKQRKLSELISCYFESKEQQNGQTALLRRDIESAAEDSTAAQAILAREPDFDSALLELRTLLSKTDNRRKGESHRSFGATPERQWILDYITELWQSDPEITAFWQSNGDGTTMARFIATALDCPESITDPSLCLLAEDAAAIAAGLSHATREMDSLIHALAGGFMHPTQGGDAAYGGREILPTGRNIHSGHQDKVPSPAAYERGVQAAKELLALYEKESGKLPEKVAMNMTSLDVTRTNGEQLGQFMALMGIRPIWNHTGRVDGLECIPLQELGRPRVDVTVQISSVMRDAWPHVLTLLDQAVQLAACQDEPDAMNYVRANAKAISREGEDGTGRIFGSEPGTYTSAVGLALKASAWKTEDDLAKYFIDSSSYLYGENKPGIRAPGAFAANIRQVDLTSDITNSRHTDAISSSYSARVQGGYRLAAKTLGSKKQIRQYMGESTPAGGIRVVTMSDHVKNAIEDTLLNDIWREQMMEQGYAGAADLMCRMQNIFDTQCVCDNIPANTLDAVAKQYLLDDNMQKWLRDNNPYALEESSRRFLELDSRGKWNGDPEILKKLRRAYLQAEGDLEDGMSGLGEIQAGNVDIVSHNQVETWNKRIQETDEVISKWKK